MHVLDCQYPSSSKPPGRVPPPTWGTQIFLARLTTRISRLPTRRRGPPRTGRCPDGHDRPALDHVLRGGTMYGNMLRGAWPDAIPWKNELAQLLHLLAHAAGPAATTHRPAPAATRPAPAADVGAAHRVRVRPVLPHERGDVALPGRRGSVLLPDRVVDAVAAGVALLQPLRVIPVSRVGVLERVRDRRRLIARVDRPAPEVERRIPRCVTCRPSSQPARSRRSAATACPQILEAAARSFAYFHCGSPCAFNVRRIWATWLFGFASRAWQRNQPVP